MKDNITTLVIPLASMVARTHVDVLKSMDMLLSIVLPLDVLFWKTLTRDVSVCTFCKQNN